MSKSARNSGMRTVLQEEDVVELLRQEVADAGGQSAWSKKTGVHRSIINRVLLGRHAPTKSIVNALGLEIVYLPKQSRKK
jgi:DNA-binding phage protein